MELEVQYFSQLHLQAQIYHLPKGLGMRKILAHIKMQKNPQTREGIFWIFTDSD